ncbi:hypothetical protein [Haliangium sp. UPWRP_2]|uniref:hypothetical protein n=1 Tax=Haliangium sp. UPWRP_2 TaxID=1931276 RepID=UPI000B53D5D9|nr:hypothetical protein [Haliangium sp. UPWRP_2]PSM31205.1 hypothetical protein BVG81_006575 [Haliangium sp. UPWRP_2]
MKPRARLPVTDPAPLGEPHQRLRATAVEIRGHDAVGAVAAFARVVLAGRGHAGGRPGERGRKPDGDQRCDRGGGLEERRDPPFTHQAARDVVLTCSR